MDHDIDDQLFKRMVLQNQYLILSHLDKQNSKDWKRAADIVQSHWPIDELPYVDMLKSYRNDAFLAADRSELLNTLDMYEVLQDAEDAGLNFKDGNASFPGYSGNEEGGHLAYYRDIVEQGMRWPSLRRSNPNDLNSHCPLLEVYQRMVEEWTTLGKPRKLSQGQVDSILTAGIHPSNR